MLGRRADGYHHLRSVMVPVGLYDRIEVTPSSGCLAFTCRKPELERDNLILQACERLGLKAAPFAIHLEKQIPVGAGLGGASSDAAAILLAAQAGVFGALGPIDWVSTARSLGSDVAFFLSQTGALIEGTGERVTPLGRLPAWWAAIVHPPVFVSTGDAYALLDAGRAAVPATKRMESASLRAAEALQRADFDALQRELVNDFTTVMCARYAPIGEALEALRSAGVAKPMLSGSGSAVYALFRDRDGAQAAAQALPAGLQTRTHIAPFLTMSAWRSADG